ncbi:MAG TPA: hypothetical protein VHQ24_15985 [Lachnospiraceae bacterium]|nr:hypothetical protein [Lachnospiraceae bacterium]HEX3078358.1 hypothetical protein [Lachnospiraceae bacterium]
MRELLLTILIGVVAGVIDVMPMIKMKLDKYAITSAFTFYLILPFITINTTLLETLWWIKGGMIGFILAVPVMVIVAKDDRKATIPMGIMSIILGSLIGIAGHYL